MRALLAFASGIVLRSFDYSAEPLSVNDLCGKGLPARYVIGKMSGFFIAAHASKPNVLKPSSTKRNQRLSGNNWSVRNSNSGKRKGQGDFGSDRMENAPSLSLGKGGLISRKA